MEYAGTGSFWSQIASPSDDQISGVIAPRRLDELLRNPDSSLVEILSDEEAISEFRSSNPKMVSRITSGVGVELLVSLIINKDVPEMVSSNQKLQLPYIASELVACEVDCLLDAMTRVIPGVHRPLDRLFDCLIDGVETNPTVLGYVVRVLLVLINRRVNVVDKYIEEHHAVVQEALLDSMNDKSVADLLFRLCLDEDIKSFTLGFNQMVVAISPENAENVVWLIDSIFGRPLLGSNEKLVRLFHQIREELLQKGGLSILVGRAFSSDSQLVARACMDILSTLIQFAFTRPAETELATPFGLDQGWESFRAPNPFSSTKPSVQRDDDSCVFDDEEPPGVASPAPLLNPTVAFGQSMIGAWSEKVNEEHFSKIVCDIQLLFSYLRLMAKIIKYSTSELSLPGGGALLGKIIVDSFSRYPKSTAVHNLCRDCVVGGGKWSMTQLQGFACVFLPATPSLFHLSSCRSHIDRIIHFLNSKYVPLQEEVYLSAIKRWDELDSRLADREKQPPSRMPSPHGVTPIIDLEPPVNDQWSSLSEPSSSHHSGTFSKLDDDPSDI